MPLITFLTVCYQETCKQRGGNLLIERFEMFHIFYPLQLASSCRPQSRGWDNWQQGLDRELLADPFPGVTGGCGICGGSLGSVGPQSLSSEVPWYFPLQRQMTLLHTGPRLLPLSPALFFSSGGLAMPLKDEQVEVQGFRSSHWADSCFP